jgi:sterol desaturase/sphingolipid hydroxylase (fatty acid hydroxylase superfamily)
MVEAFVIIVIAFLVPIHPLAIAVFLFLMTIYNVYRAPGLRGVPGLAGKQPG